VHRENAVPMRSCRVSIRHEVATPLGMMVHAAIVPMLGRRLCARILSDDRVGVRAGAGKTLTIP
jgi:hypothetical protein